MLDLHGLLADIPEVKGHAPGKNQEYVNGWGIFALPFESGDLLALRVFPQNDFSNPTIGEFRLPSRGVLVKGSAVWDVLDSVEYERTRAETGHGTRLTTWQPSRSALGISATCSTRSRSCSTSRDEAGESISSTY
jgi:hypothetical protein